MLIGFHSQGGALYSCSMAGAAALPDPTIRTEYTLHAVVMANGFGSRPELSTVPV